MLLEKISKGAIYYNNQQPKFTREYYYYCVKLLKSYLINSNKEINIIFGEYEFDFQNELRTLKIDFQYEHTLVKQEGRGSETFQRGKIKDVEDFYLVRIPNYENLQKNDIVIEYSIPNIINIQTSELFTEYSKKLVYIAPVIYDIQNPSMESRNINCITMFYDIYQERRRKLLENIYTNGINSINVNNCFSKSDLYNLYSNIKIMLNIHQTPHHHTFEELRVLPAILNGVLVICEDSPLKEKIPYNDFIIWSPYDKIIDKLKEVENDYVGYWERIFGDGRLGKIHKRLEIENKENLFRILDERTNLFDDPSKNGI